MKKFTVILANAQEIKKLFENFIAQVEASHTPLKIKNVWGKPQENETWEDNPKNHWFTELPLIGTHHSPDVLFSVQLTSPDDVLRMHFSGVYEWYRQYIPRGYDINDCPYHTKQICEGDEVYIDDMGITVIPKKPDAVMNKICSWRLCTN